MRFDLKIFLVIQRMQLTQVRPNNNLMLDMWLLLEVKLVSISLY